MADRVPSVAPAQTTPSRKLSFKETKFKPYGYGGHCKCNPWPCTSLQSAAKIIAIVEFAINFVHLTPIVITLVGEIKKTSGDSKGGTLISFFAATIFGLIILPSLSLILDIFLLLGALQWSRWKCCVYFFGTSLIHFMAFVTAVIRVAVEAYQEGIFLVAAVAASTIIFYLVCIYFKVVVYAFMKEIKSNPVQPQVPDQQPVSVESAPPEEENAAV